MPTDAPHLLTSNMDDIQSPEALVSVHVLIKQFVNFLSEYVNTYWHKEFHLSEPCLVEHNDENN